jgi:hypothetical protein
MLNGAMTTTPVEDRLRDLVVPVDGSADRYIVLTQH